MTKQTARKWTYKGTTASLAVLMAFGATPMFATAAFAAESQPDPIVQQISAEGAAENNAEENGVVGILSAAASYGYEGYEYGTSATVVNSDGSSADVTSYYEGESIASVGDDMARYLGALHRADGAQVDSIVFNDQSYEWNEAAGLQGSNWVKEGTSTADLESAKQNGTLSGYTLVGAIAKSLNPSTDDVDASEANLPQESLSVNLALQKGIASYNVTLGGASGGIDTAVDQAEPGSTVVLNKDWSLDEKVSLGKDIAIDGDGHNITGQADDAGVYLEVTGGTFALSNAKLSGFGGTAATQSGNGVIKVPAEAAAGTKVVATNVDFSGFNRSAFDIQAGSFEISGGAIDCGNEGKSHLTKGVKVGGSNQKVTGTISGVSISNSSSTYEEWDTAAIEVYNNADVDIAGVKISNVKNGISVDNYWYDTMGNITVDISGESEIAATGSAIRVYGKEGALGKVAVNVSGGSYSGALKAIASDASVISVTGGTFDADPSEFVASGYKATESEGSWTVAKESSGGGTGGGTDVPSEGDTVTNEDGSVTTTVTGEDGSTTATTEAADGSASTVVEKDPEGNVTSIEATVAGDAAPESIVALPMEPVVTADDANTAVSITVKAPEGTKVSVPVAKSEGAQSISPGSVLVMVDAEGNEISMPKTGVSESGLTLEVPGDCTLKVVDSSIDFPDMAGDEWYAEKGVADFISARGIMTGVEVEPGSFEFQGDESTNRGMFVTMLHRLELEPSAEGSKGFSDVSTSSWYADSSTWAVDAGVTTGFIADDGSATFEGDGAVSREQMATFLYRYANWLNMDTSARADISDVEGVSDWASEALSWAVAEGLIQGDDETGEIRPDDGATRAEAAAVIMRMVELFYQ